MKIFSDYVEYTKNISEISTLTQLPQSFKETCLIKNVDKYFTNKKIDINAISKIYGGKEVSLAPVFSNDQRIKMLFDDYIKNYWDNKNHYFYYLKDLMVSESDYNILISEGASEIIENWLHYLPSELNPKLRWLYIGTPYTFSGFHYDIHNSSALNLLCEGAKLWFFLPNEPIEKSRNLKAHTSKILWAEKIDNLSYCVQNEGDLVYVHSDCPHMVINLSNSTSFTENMINSDNYKRVFEQLEKKGDLQFLKILKILKNKIHEQVN